MRQVIIYAGEDGYWVAECPSLPGCISQGRTREEAIANIREAIQGYVAALEEDRSSPPQPLPSLTIGAISLSAHAKKRSFALEETREEDAALFIF